MCQLLYETSITISKQSLDFRFTESAVNFMRAMYQECLRLFESSLKFDGGILQKFNNVKLLDSSSIMLPESMKELYRGHGSEFKHLVVKQKPQLSSRHYIIIQHKQLAK